MYCKRLLSSWCYALAARQFFCSSSVSSIEGMKILYFYYAPNQLHKGLSQKEFCFAPSANEPTAP